MANILIKNLYIPQGVKFGKINNVGRGLNLEII